MGKSFWEEWGAVLILLASLGIGLLLVLPKVSRIEVVSVDSISDALCDLTVNEQGRPTSTVYREIPCSIASGPLELQLTGTPFCLDGICEHVLHARGQYSGEPDLIKVKVDNSLELSVTIEVHTPRG